MEERYILTVSKQGQVTIPAKVRKQLKIGGKNGNQLYMVKEGDGEFGIKMKSKKNLFNDIFGSVKPTKNHNMPIEQAIKEGLQHMARKNSLIDQK